MALKDLFRTKPISKILQQGGDGEHSGGLHKVLTVKDLTFFGVAAIIGGGTFSAIGNACFSGGPGVILLYIICAVACGFTAMCYAEFASRVPVSGSAYTYAYVSSASFLPGLLVGLSLWNILSGIFILLFHGVGILQNCSRFSIFIYPNG